MSLSVPSCSLGIFFVSSLSLLVNLNLEDIESFCLRLLMAVLIIFQVALRSCLCESNCNVKYFIFAFLITWLSLFSYCLYFLSVSGLGQFSRVLYSLFFVRIELNIALGNWSTRGCEMFLRFFCSKT